MSDEVFRGYARYYDLLYRGKDYSSEVGYVEQLAEAFGVKGSRPALLDVGCGTGRHAALFAERGYTVVGLDASQAMIAIARETAGPAARFVQADARDFSLPDRFSFAVSLFHVASYQTQNSDLRGYFASIARHLLPGGLFVFDSWYGPAVLCLRPSVRTSELEDESVRIVRIAQPDLLPQQNSVVVNYDLLVEEKATHSLSRLRESHRMRYLFVPEVELLLQEAGLELLHCEEWQTRRPLGLDTWSACFVARRLPSRPVPAGGA